MIRGITNKRKQARAWVRGRRNFVGYVNARFMLRSMELMESAAKRIDRIKPEVIAALAVRTDKDDAGNDVQVVLSEKRREHWPEPTPVPVSKRDYRLNGGFWKRNILKNHRMVRGMVKLGMLVKKEDGNAA